MIRAQVASYNCVNILHGRSMYKLLYDYYIYIFSDLHCICRLDLPENVSRVLVAPAFTNFEHGWKTVDFLGLAKPTAFSFVDGVKGGVVFQRLGFVL